MEEQATFRPSQSRKALLVDAKYVWAAEGWIGTMCWCIDLAQVQRRPRLPEGNPEIFVDSAAALVRQTRRHWRRSRPVRLGPVIVEEVRSPVRAARRPLEGHPYYSVNAHVEAHVRTRFKGLGGWRLLHVTELPTPRLLYSVEDRLVAIVAPIDERRA